MPVSMDAVVTVQCFAVNKNDDLAMLLTRPGDVDIVAAPDSINASVSDHVSLVVWVMSQCHPYNRFTV